MIFMKSKNIIIAVLALLLVGGLVWFSSQKRAPTEVVLTEVPAASGAADSSSATSSTLLSQSMNAQIYTNFGVLELEFFMDVAPETVKNFVTLAEKGFYDGTAFHRIVQGFMIQGGDPLTKDPAMADQYGTGGPGYNVKAEFNNRPHVRGTLSMARSGHPDSAGSQFFICLDDARFLDGQYTAFGKVVKGEDVLLAMGAVATKLNASGTEKSVPIERVSVEKITITRN